jgi:Type IV secretion-system coupling protein DNA-binding domain
MSDALVSSRRELPDVPAASAEELLAAAFSDWEQRGRGWTLFDFPVELEPPFCSFYDLLDVPQLPVTDDGRSRTFWSRLADDWTGKPTTADHSSAIAHYRRQLAEYQAAVSEAHQPLPCRYLETEFSELQLILPKDLKTAKTTAENLLLSFSYLSCPVSFEIIGTEAEIVVQFACSEPDAAQVRQQLRAHLPRCLVRETSDYLTNVWLTGDAESLIVDFGLSNEFFLPLKTSSYLDADLFVTVIGALADLVEDEVGIFQVLLQKTQNDWAQDAAQAVGYLEETGTYPKTSGALHSVKEKTRTPLFAACLRVAGKSFNEHRTWRIVKSIGAGLTSLANPGGNELIPLSNDGYGEDDHEEALLSRQSFREGMLLNLDELAGLVHPPTSAVQSDKLQRETDQTKAAPALALHHALILGENFHQGETWEVSLSNDQRTKHIHLIGASGSGKSTLMIGLIKQDLENGQGLCVIDPHGDLIDSCLENVPENRIKDVVLFDPSDAEYPIGFNILQANSELEKTLLSSDLIATFRRMSTSWGDVMDSILANAILAFVESERGGTLFDLKRFLVEKDFRSEFLKTVNDEAIRYFWQNEFPLIAGKPQSSILIRLDTFLRQKLIRHIVCQKDNKIDFRRIMDERKILLVKLSQGAIGEENSHLLGTLLVSKLYQTALSRQDTQNRPFFSCYLDEFHHFITPSMESVLSGVRKYNLGLVLAHQEFRQLQSRNAEVASSVLSNCYTRVCFRLGDTDAEKFAGGFSFFDAQALQNLSVGEAVGRIERAEYDFNLKIDLPPKISKEVAEVRKREIVRHSRENYATPVSLVEANLFPDSAKPAIESAADKLKADHSEPTSNTEVTETFRKTKATSEKPPSEITSDKGNEHRYLQGIIKRIGENAGFVATLEKQVFGGVGKVDVALESESLKIACEIAATNTVEYELQNIQKCLASGYDKVAVISSDSKHLTNIRRKAESIIASEQLSKVHFLEPENFHLFLEKLNADSVVALSDGKVKGYTVKAGFKEISETEKKTRTQTVFEILSNAIRRKGKK